MKKLLTFLMMSILTIGVGWAETQEITFNKNGNGDVTSNGPTTVGIFTITLTDGSSANNWNSNYNHVRFQSQSTMRIQCSDNYTMTTLSIDFSGSYTFGSNGVKFEDGTSGNSIGSYTESGSTGTWTAPATGGTSDLLITNLKSSQARITKITITYEEGGSTTTVATPVISGNTPFEGSTEVSIACETTGSKIYYTLDGNEPTTSSTLYSAPFTINATTTVKAIAYVGEDASSIATKKFVKYDISSIAEFNALENGDNFKYTGNNLVAIAQTSNGASLYVQDGDKGMLIFKNGGIGQTYELGEKIPAGFTGTRSVFNGAPEMTNPVGLAASTESVTLTPIEMTATDVKLDNFGLYGVIKNAYFNTDNKKIIVGEEEIPYHTTFLTPPTDGAVYDIYGVVGYYNTYAQFLPFKVEPVVSNVNYYLAGSFTEWTTKDEYKFTELADGSYVLTGKNLSDETNGVKFKIIKVEGESTTWYGGTNDGDYEVKSDHHTNMDMYTGNENNYVMTFGGVCDFTINTNNMKLSVEKEKNLFICGDMNNWGKTQMDKTDNGWKYTTGEITAGKNFKFRDEWSDWYGGGTEINESNLGSNITVNSGDNFVISIAGNFDIVVNSAINNMVVSRVLIPHNIVIDSDIDNGSISIEGDKTSEVAGEIVTIIVTPDEGYELEKLSVNTEDDEIEVNENYQFTMPDADVLVSASFKEKEPESMVYRLVTDMSDFVAGKKYLIANLGATALIGNLTGNSGKQYAQQVTSGFTYDSETNTITLEEDCGTTIITLGGSADAWTFNNGSGYLAYTGTTTSSNNYLWLVSSATANGATWKIDLNGGAKNVQNNYNTSRYLQYNSTSGQERFSGYTGSLNGVAFYKQVEAGEVFAPVIEGETPFLETTTVTITCATEGAEIRYTTNGVDPTAESQLYSEPFTLTDAATVKAIAIKGGNSSSIVSKEFEKIPSVATVAEYLELEKDDVFVFTGDAVVTYQNGSNTWIKDATGYALIYASEQPTYSNGDVIPTGWGGKKTIYNGVPEITNPTGLTGATEKADATPEVKTVADITTDDVNAYYQIKDITLSDNSNNFNIVDGEDELVGYNKFGIIMPEDVEGKKFNVVGVITIYNNEPEFYIISYEEIIQPVSLEGVTFTDVRQWATWCGEENLALPEGVTAYVVTGVNTAGTAVEVAPVDYIPAGIGVLLYSETPASNLTAEVYTGEVDEELDSELKGTLDDMTVSEDVYVLYNNKFILAQNGTTVGAHRCYLPASVLEETGTQSGAPVLRIALPGTVTGIEDLRYDSNGKPVGYYDLTGRYVGTSLNGKRGIFITSDGKKVVK